MTISVECPHCGKVLKAKDSAAGKKAKCPSCGDVLTVPDAPDVFDAEEFGAGSEDPGDSDDMDFGAAEQNMPATKDRKPCPACGEMIAKDAAKCRFCDEVLDPALKKKLKKKSSSGTDSTDLTPLEYFVCFCCSGIGCIYGIIQIIQGKPTGGKILGLSIASAIFWNVVKALVEVAVQQQGR